MSLKREPTVWIRTALPSCGSASGRHLTNEPGSAGILLTKFDTIDDKVGAAVSMVYATGQPVLMVGVGQTYTVLPPLI